MLISTLTPPCGQAFAIFFAYEFSQYFVHVIGGGIFGLPLSKWDTLWSYCIWMAVAYIFTPLVNMTLSSFNNAHHASRSIFRDAGCLFKDSLPVMVLWSFKVRHCASARTHIFVAGCRRQHRCSHSNPQQH